MREVGAAGTASSRVVEIRLGDLLPAYVVGKRSSGPALGADFTLNLRDADF
jgi:hypothetical protein